MPQSDRKRIECFGDRFDSIKQLNESTDLVSTCASNGNLYRLEQTLANQTQRQKLLGTLIKAETLTGTCSRVRFCIAIDNYKS